MNFKRSRKSRCLATALSAIVLATVCAGTMTGTLTASAVNIISNSDFESGIAKWGMYKESGGAATLSGVDGKLALKVTSVGEVNYAVQMYYDIIPLYKNGVYRLKYDISSSIDRYAEGMIQQNGGTYQAYTWKGLDLTSKPLSIDYTFTMEEETDIMAKLVFNCGTQGEALPEHTIYLDNVSLELIDDSNVDYSANKAYEPSIITNQVGYAPDAKKIAVFRDVTNETEFSVVNATTKAKVFTGKLTGKTENASAGETDYLGDFSSVTEPGSYYIECGALDDSYSFDIGEKVYGALLDDTVRMQYLQRCGCAIVDDEFDHVACHTGKAKIYGTNNMIDVSGGWHDAGDYGRYVVPGAKTVADLLYAYQATPELYSDNSNIPESGNGVPDILDEVRYELTWMLKMQEASGGVYHKVTCATFPGYVMPEAETKQLIVTPVTTTATADFCAAMAMAYEFYLDVDKNFAETCLSAAKKAWGFLQQNPNFIYKNPEDITTGAYNDTTDKDERYWAAAQMYRATGDTAYLNGAVVKTGMDWSTVGDYGSIALLTMKNADTSSSLYADAKSAVLREADGFAKNSAASPYGVALTRFNWGSNMTVANAGVILGLAAQITGDNSYMDAAKSNLNYLLGCNPNATCFVTGYGTVSPLNPHHRPSMAKGKAMKGMLVGGVNSSLEDSAAEAYLATAPSAKCYIDNSESYSTNEICIYWNSPLTYLLSMTEQAGGSAPQEVVGDVNGNGTLGVEDAVLLQRYLVNDATLTAAQAKAANLCADEVINAFDLAALKKLLLK